MTTLVRIARASRPVSGVLFGWAATVTAPALLNIGAYVLAAILTVATGYTVTGLRMPTAAMVLALVLGGIALLVGLAAYRSTTRA